MMSSIKLLCDVNVICVAAIAHATKRSATIDSQIK